MTVKKFESRFSIGAFLMYLTSLLLLVVGYVTYTFLPESDSFTNSIDVSGAETVKAFTVAPILILLSCIAFCAFNVVYGRYFFKLSLSDNKFGDKVISDLVIKIVSVSVSFLLIAFMVISTCFAFALLNDFKELGFVAPVTDTVYEGYGKFILAVCILQFVFLILTTVKMLGFSITDSIGSLIKNKEKKS